MLGTAYFWTLMMSKDKLLKTKKLRHLRKHVNKCV